ncbi:MAG: xanthine dehydrogenase family protein subunit M [Pseudonocardiaceae bacterium]|nr:MAG: xanthine dehydrogenase family protein subunit M [Pseudonocardiaceae bacterium]
MKPAPFDYIAPTDISGVLDAVAVEDAKILAGGQSLVPMLNFRLARPALLVDITRVHDLRHLRRVDGRLHIGAATTHTDVEHSPLVREHWPLLSDAVRHIGHSQIRNAGTIGGSLAHADPAAELPAVMLALDAQMTIATGSGNRTVPARDFFHGYLQTALAPDELLTEIVLPHLPTGSGADFSEIARRSGDFALAGVAVQLQTSTDGICTSAAVALIGAGPVPLRSHAAEQRLIGSELTSGDIAECVQSACLGLNPPADLHGSADYRRRILAAQMQAGLERAAMLATADRRGHDHAR